MKGRALDVNIKIPFRQDGQVIITPVRSQILS